MTMPRQRPYRSKQDYTTPQVFIDAVKMWLDIRTFAFDFAADKTNTKAVRYWTEQDDSLSIPATEWARHCGQGWGWLNPPYANIGPWAARCLETASLGGHIAFLVPASVGSNWYRDYIHDQLGVTVLFLNGRIPFIPNKPNWLYPKDCMLVLFGTGQPLERNFESDVWAWRSERTHLKIAATRRMTCQSGRKSRRSSTATPKPINPCASALSP